VGLITLPCKKKIAEKPPRNSARFCGESQGLGWAVEPRKEEERRPLNTNLLTPWWRVLLEKLTVAQIIQKFPVFHETQRFIPCSQQPEMVPILSQMNPVHTFPPYFPNSPSNIIFASTPRSSERALPSGFPTKLLPVFLIPYACYVSCPSHPPLFDHPSNGDAYK
jgi:hypothetical protein